ncbi:LLM class flavin-dependent oxidoreductase [Sphingobium amiense]|uniref:LLM class flavin-dependent oxidoreductase n=1 Tax=Sphingobium amiense TaxID=135719 RepID=A0A494WDH0_9SPHN|nr:LLM class flavin-dependent oxidoreductase [Sphingobium amiense]BBD98429.1 LLM class flavin-dependent oxidoreductase [Sphingobium amiense]
MPSSRLRFGAFVAPFHPVDENPMLWIERDLELAEWLDRLGYDEFWMGEHHSGGYEINASPEVFIAAASQRTRTIKFGTGVSSVPYHHPLMLADRMRQLDYLTRGRTMFGIGPGSLPSDAHMQGIPTSSVRDRLDASIEPLVRLLRGETVTTRNEWFTLQEARLQLLPYDEQGMEIAVASMVSPTGARAAGQWGLSMLSIGATSAGAFNGLGSNWAIAEQMAQDHGQRVDRSRWRLAGPVHVAETREKARENMRYGLAKWVDYFASVAALPFSPAPGLDPVDAMIDTGFAVIGTPDDCIAQIARLQEQSGGFGCFLQIHVPWADWAETKRSYELIARHVMPKVNGLNVNRHASEHCLRNNNALFRGELQSAQNARVAQHAAQKGEANLNPDILAMLKEKAQ